MKHTAKFLIPLTGVLVLFPFVTPATSLVAGVLLALIFESPYPTKMYTHLLLTSSVVGLGAGMNLDTIARVGIEGLGYTFVSIAFVFAIGLALQKLFKVESESALLIIVGTAICGGSAIAAITPVIRAKSPSVSVALGTVFILNAVALILFPPIGHYFAMSERSFGIWSALAIHDTSSVVGATVAYGKVAAEVGTSVKLARALWIVPLTFIIAYFYKSENKAKSKKPWFILGFLVAAAIVTNFPALQPAGHIVELIARRMLVLTLFFIGLSLSRETLKQVGVRPLLLGLSLWLIVLGATLLAVQNKLLV